METTLQERELNLDENCPVGSGVEPTTFRTAATEVDKGLTNSATVAYHAYSTTVLFSASILTACEKARDCNPTRDSPPYCSEYAAYQN